MDEFKLRVGLFFSDNFMFIEIWEFVKYKNFILFFPLILNDVPVVKYRIGISLGIESFVTFGVELFFIICG